MMPRADQLSISACETTPQGTKVETEAREDMKAVEISEGESKESTPSDTTELAPEPTPTTIPRKEDDTRVTELRLLSEKFKEWAGKACNCAITISGENILSFQLTLQGSIEFIGDLDEHIERQEQMNQRLQQDYEQQCRENHQLSAGSLQMQSRIRFLKRNNESLKGKCDELEKYVGENEFARRMLQNENGDLLEAVAAMEGRAPAARVESWAEDTVAANVDATKADAGYKTESSEEGRSRKRTRLN